MPYNDDGVQRHRSDKRSETGSVKASWDVED